MPAPRQLLQRLRSRLVFLRYKYLARGPTLEQWEERLHRVTAKTVEESLLHIPERGGVLVDVGANVGIYAEKVLERRPDCTAYLFEPVEAHYRRCAERFRGRPNVFVEHFALGDVEGEMTIWKPKHNPGGNCLVDELVQPRTGVFHFEPERVRCRVFDHYAKERGIARADFIKCDAEGFDYRVLRGMLGFLEGSNPRPVIVAELLSQMIHHDWPAQVALVEELYRLGYQKVDLSSIRGVGDVLFLPEGEAAAGFPRRERAG